MTPILETPRLSVWSRARPLAPCKTSRKSVASGTAATPTGTTYPWAGRSVFVTNGKLHIIRTLEDPNRRWLHTYSTDSGETWTSQSIFSSAEEPRMIWFDFDADGDRLYCIYHIQPPGDYPFPEEVWIKQTAIDGITWQDPQLLYSWTGSFLSISGGPVSVSLRVYEGNRHYVIVDYVTTGASLELDCQVLYSLNGNTPEVVKFRHFPDLTDGDPGFWGPAITHNGTDIMVVWFDNSDLFLRSNLRQGGAWGAEQEIFVFSQPTNEAWDWYSLHPLSNNRYVLTYFFVPSPRYMKYRIHNSTWGGSNTVGKPANAERQTSPVVVDDTLFYLGSPESLQTPWGVWSVPLSTAPQANTHTSVVIEGDFAGSGIETTPYAEWQDIFWKRRLISGSSTRGYHGGVVTRPTSSSIADWKIWYFRLCKLSG